MTANHLADKRRPGTRGFTLIEVMVALAILALMAILSWRGLEGMRQTKDRTDLHTQQVQALQTGLAQWTTDLDNMASTPFHNGIDWDGRVLRVTRRQAQQDDAGLLLVAWTRRVVDGTGQWLRWQSPPVRDRAALEQAWSQAELWAQNPGDEAKQHEVAVAPLEQWQIFYYRNDAWSNPLSSAGNGVAGNGASAAAAMGTTAFDPNQITGVRLVLTLPAGYAVQGSLTRDWVRPTAGVARS